MEFLKNKAIARVLIFITIFMMFFWMIPGNVIFGEGEGGEQTTETTVTEESSPPPEETPDTGEGETTEPEETTDETVTEETTTETIEETFDTKEPVITIEMFLPDATFNANSLFEYQIKVTNNGEAKATDVKVITQVPENISYMSDDSGGFFDTETNSTSWSMSEIAVGETKTLEIELGIPSVIDDGSIKTIITTVECSEIEVKGLIKSEFTVLNPQSIINNEVNNDVSEENVTSTLEETTFDDSTSDDTISEEIKAEETTETTETLEEDMSSTEESDLETTSEEKTEDTQLETLETQTVTNPLSISMSDNPDPVAPGQSVTYTINYLNAGTTALSGVTITDFLPEGTVLVSTGITGIAQGQSVFWDLGTLEPGQSGSVSVVVNIPTSSEDGSIFINTAVIDSNETEAVSVIEDTLDPTVYGSQLFYVFGWAPDVLSLLSSTGYSNPYSATASEGIRSILSISNAASGTVTAYLQNYADTTPFNPVNPTSNPNVKTITINPGDVYTIDDLIYSTYSPTSDPSTWKMAGGDLLYILGGPVNVVRGFSPAQSNGTVWAEYWNLYPVNMWDDDYIVPVGIDTYGKTGNTGDGQDMKYTDLLIEASENGTVVTIDDPVNGTTTIALNRGQNYIYKYGGQFSKVHQGLKITSNNVVQAGLLTSSGGGVDTRNYNLSAKELLGREYYIPVDTQMGDRLYVYAFEDGTSVTIDDGTGGNPTVIFSLNKGQVNSSYVLSSGHAPYITSNKTIQVLGAADSNESDKDWGFQAIDIKYYSSSYVTPFSPGNNYGYTTSTSTTTTSAVNATQTSIPVSSTSSFSSSGFIKIDNEIINYSSKTSSSFEGCRRGRAGTTPVSHNSGRTVSQYVFSSPDADWNPLHITPTSDNTRIYVDWNGDGIADLPYSGASYNYVDVNRFGIVKLYDTIEGDGDNGGAHIWALSTTAGGTGNWATDKNNSNTRTIVVYYGEQNGADSSAGYDWGYVLLPLSPEFVDNLVINKSSNPVSGASVSAGQTITYTLSFQNTSTDVTYANVILKDIIPIETTLVSGSISDGGTESGGTIT